MSEQDKMLQVGQVLEGRYRIVSKGAPQDLGLLFKAYDVQSDRLAAVLLLDRRFDGRLETLERLTRSQQRVADLAEPALLPYEHIGRIEGQLYLARDHIEGQTLAEMLHRAGPMGPKKALEVAIPLCEALAAAHRVGLVHGSLGPYSVLVADDGSVTVTDADLLPSLRPIPAPPNQPWGRFPYLSPEQAAGETVHPASDVYVLGLLIYGMLTGEPPFYHGDEASQAVQHLRQDPAPLQTLAPDAPLPLARIVHKALAKEPAARYRNAGQLAHILYSQLGAQIPTRQPEPATPQRAAAQERLVVPPPPALVLSAPQTRDVYEATATAETWAEEPVGVDWLMIGLIIAALIAVLGLIPLWRTVYRRYAAPPPSAPVSYHLARTDDSLVAHHTGETRSVLSLRDAINRLHRPSEVIEPGEGPLCNQQIPGLGVKITVFDPHCITL